MGFQKSDYLLVMYYFSIVINKGPVILIFLVIFIPENEFDEL